MLAFISLCHIHSRFVLASCIGSITLLWAPGVFFFKNELNGNSFANKVNFLGSSGGIQRTYLTVHDKMKLKNINTVIE